MLHACILAGGRGERFWPLSRADRPKQLTRLTGDRTMLRLAFERLSGAVPPDRTLVLTSASITAAVKEEISELPETNVIGEPIGRSSAPAIALAAAIARAKDPAAVLLVVPSDHVIDREPFLEALAEAAGHAEAHDDLVTFGIRPTRPETAYGYVETGESLGGSIRRARSFREKPDRETARRFLDDGRFLWNSGMFVFRAAVLLDAIDTHAPEIAAALAEIDLGGHAVGEDALRRYLEAVPSISIDYAVMEKATNVAVSAASFGWCDVGSWSALGDVVPADARGNVSIGDVVSIDADDCVLFSDDGLVAAVGVKGLAVVRAGNATLVCPREEAERVREVIEALRSRGPSSESEYL